MQKLYLAKNKYGQYYTKISNQKQKCDLFMSVNLPTKDTQLARDYGTFECEYYVSCYQTKDGDVRPVIKITKLYNGVAMDVNAEVNPEGAKSVDPFVEYNSDDVPF